MNKIIIKDLSKTFGKSNKSIKIIENLNISIEKESFSTFFGPNGCGKTTLMNILSGLESYNSGTLKIASNSNVSYLFQDYRNSLLPWADVKNNILFPLKIQKIGKNERENQLDKLLTSLNIDIDLKEKVINLSGGQSQLVCILRSLIVEPEILILDEPFSALDFKNSLDLRLKLLDFWQKLGITILFISHDIEEAIFLGTQLYMLSKKPMNIIDIIDIEFPYPRNPQIIRKKEFADLKRRALNIFMEATAAKNNGR